MFITLRKCGSMSQNFECDTRIAVEDIASYEQPDACYPTDIYLKSGRSFSVQESPTAIDKLIKAAT